MNALWRAQEEGHYRDGDYVLVVTGDLPLLSSSALERFIAGCREAPDADLYLGMIPAESIPEALRPAYRRDLLPFCGGSYLHSDVYLLRPDAVTPAGYKRFEEIVTIRRSDLNRLHGALRVAITLVRIVGVQGLLAFFRILAALSGRSRRTRRRARPEFDVVERITMGLIEKRFGPKVSFVMVQEPSLALEFDHAEQLELLAEHANHDASH